MDLYTEIILDHYKNPKNYGSLENAMISVVEYNHLCGDKVKMDFFLEDGKIKELRFEGNGCAISQASTSMLTEKLIGMTVKDVAAISNQYVYDMINIPISPARVKCALLGLMCAKRAMGEVDKK